MCIRDRGDGPLLVVLGHFHTLDVALVNQNLADRLLQVRCGDIPVSYTHLDVYKRQGEYVIRKEGKAGKGK